MRLELFYAPGCSKCAEGKQELRTMAEKTVPDVRWCELNVLDELDYAVEVGVITLPSIAIDGEVVFSSLPSCHQLRRELLKRSGKGA